MWPTAVRKPDLRYRRPQPLTQGEHERLWIVLFLIVIVGGLAYQMGQDSVPRETVRADPAPRRVWTPPAK